MIRGPEYIAESRETGQLLKSILVFIEVGEHDISGRTDYQIYDFNRECRRLKEGG